MAADIIDFTGYRKKLEKQINDIPGNFIFTDLNGVTWYMYGAAYVDYNGIEMCFNFWALNDDDAAKRLDMIRNTEVVFGVVSGTTYLDDPT